MELKYDFNTKKHIKTPGLNVLSIFNNIDYILWKYSKYTKI